MKAMKKTILSLALGLTLVTGAGQVANAAIAAWTANVMQFFIVAPMSITIPFWGPLGLMWALEAQPTSSGSVEYRQYNTADLLAQQVEVGTLTQAEANEVQAELNEKGTITVNVSPLAQNLSAQEKLEQLTSLNNISPVTARFVAALAGVNL